MQTSHDDTKRASSQFCLRNGQVWPTCELKKTETAAIESRTGATVPHTSVWSTQEPQESTQDDIQVAIDGYLYRVACKEWIRSCECLQCTAVRVYAGIREAQ
jgi:hypothetical protein